MKIWGKGRGYMAGPDGVSPELFVVLAVLGIIWCIGFMFTELKYEASQNIAPWQVVHDRIK